MNLSVHHGLFRRTTFTQPHNIRINQSINQIQIPDPDADKPYADLERTPRPLRNEDYMGDVIVQKARQKRDFKFVFKRKIFLPSHNQASEDNMFSRLVYLQVGFSGSHER